MSASISLVKADLALITVAYTAPSGGGSTLYRLRVRSSGNVWTTVASTIPGGESGQATVTILSDTSRLAPNTSYDFAIHSGLLSGGTNHVIESFSTIAATGSFVKTEATANSITISATTQESDNYFYLFWEGVEYARLGAGATTERTVTGLSPFEPYVFDVRVSGMSDSINASLYTSAQTFWTTEKEEEEEEQQISVSPVTSTSTSSASGRQLFDNDKWPNKIVTHSPITTDDRIQTVFADRDILLNSFISLADRLEGLVNKEVGPSLVTEPSLTLQAPTLRQIDRPDTSSLGDVDVTGIPDVPTFEVRLSEFPDVPEAEFTRPDITYYSPPADTIGSAPIRPQLNLDIEFPDTPDFTLPTPPSISDIALPRGVDIDFAALQQELREVMATAPSLSAQEESALLAPIEALRDGFSGHLEASQNQQVDRFNATIGDTRIFQSEQEAFDVIIAIIQGDRDTALPAHIEQALFDRGRDRLERELLAQEQDAMLDMSLRGFVLPQGVLLHRLDTVRADHASKRFELNRDLIIQQHQQKIEELWRSIETTLNTAAQRFPLYAQMMAEGRQALQVRAGIIGQAIESKINLLQVKVGVYTATLQAFEQAVRLELADLERYRGELEAARLRNEINEQDIRIYLARIQAVQSRADLFRTEMEASRIRLEGEATKAQVYTAEIQGFNGEVQAYATRVGAYGERIRAEGLKASVYETDVRVYGEQVRAYASEVDALAKQDDIKLRKGLAKIQAVDSQIGAYSARVDAETRALQTKAQRLDTLARVYATETQAAVSEAATLMEFQRNQTNLEDLITRVRSANATQEFEASRLNRETLIGVLTSLSQLYAQVGAAALSTVNLSRSFSESLSSSTSQSGSRSQGESVSA